MLQKERTVLVYEKDGSDGLSVIDITDLSVRKANAQRRSLAGVFHTELVGCCSNKDFIAMAEKERAKSHEPEPEPVGMA